MTYGLFMVLVTVGAKSVWTLLGHLDVSRVRIHPQIGLASTRNHLVTPQLSHSTRTPHHPLVAPSCPLSPELQPHALRYDA